MTKIREKAGFTKGRVIVRAKTVWRGEANRVDYLLFYRPNAPLSAVEVIDKTTAIWHPDHTHSHAGDVIELLTY